MIKGIIALFSSGLILAPQVLVGIVLGLYFGAELKPEQIKAIYCNYHFYTMVFALVAIYVFSFKRTYKENSDDIDWQDNLLRVLGYSAMFFVANILAISFIYMLAVGSNMNIRLGLEVLRQNIKNAPERPGVYRMIDENEVVLYVGKAKNIKKRIVAYSRLNKLPVRLQQMVAQICKMEFVVVENEAQALLLENEYIKKFEPKYNILL